ncbi:molybdopterin molybdotransferase MoeA [Candidatus Bathyarchaeota archaeon]|nr:molybdopterin molybdotransferase MoeA [Candidatus Bathyarchaeota archaeon]
MKREDQKRIFKLTTCEKALKQFLDATSITPLGHEEVALEEAVGRVLAVDFVSEVNIPEENRTVFDGYAVMSADTKEASLKKTVVLRVVSKLFPGDVPQEILSGQAVFTATGASIPRGADAVVKVENTRLLREEIEILSPIQTNENIAQAGEDVKKGGLIFKSGHFLRPQDVGLLAGMGRRSVTVFKKPKVGIISVGDELVSLSKKNPLKIVNNYALIISCLVTEYGGTPQLIGIVPDDLDKIKETISMALKKTDVVATIAGCSIGPKDLVPDAIKALGKPGLIFHGLKLSPGKVVGAGVVEGKPIVMLPGHIVSTYAGFYLFIIPLIAQYSGLNTENLITVVKARMEKNVKAKPTANFLRVRLINVNGEYVAKPVSGGSSRLTTLMNSNGYTITPRGKGIKKGSVVDVVLYNSYELTHLTS